MGNVQFPNRKSPRAAWHDYNGGIYHVTICTKNMKHYFGEIIVAGNEEPQMVLSELGKYAEENLKNITAHYPYAEIPLFVVMPNHIHVIVIIDNAKTPYERRKIDASGWMDGVRPVHPPSVTASPHSTSARPSLDFFKGWLSVTIGGFKSAITKYANQNHISFAWHSRYHDQIIRDQTALNHIANYIENNVAKWKEKIHP